MKRILLPLLLLAGLLSGVPTAAPPMVTAATTDYQPAVPVNMSVYYAVERAAATKVHPNKPVDNGDVEVIRNKILDMQYGGQQVGLYSWFGINSYPDRVFGNHLRAADDNSFRWAVLNENEGQGKNPTVTQARADLDHVYSRYGKDPSYFRIGGKPVMFLYGDAGDTCSAAARWRSADSLNRFYLVMKTVSGYTRCSPQPQGWYGYAPANGHWQQGNSYAVSPGFNKVGESAARLPRSVSRFATDLRAMKAAKVRFKIITTWNEWTEATGVESATEWRSGSGHGAYVDQMHSILGQVPSVPAPPNVLNAVTSGQDVNLSWSASTGATSYQVFRNGCLLTTVTGTSYTDGTLVDASASYAVKAVSFRGTSRRGPVRIGTAGSPSPAPASSNDGLVAMRGERILSTATGAGVGCASRQRGQALVTLPSSVPANATSVVLTVTALNALGNGAVQVFPAGSAAPAGVSQVRYYSTRASSNTMTVPVGTGRQLVVQQSGAATHLYVDVIGYTVPGVSAGLDVLSTTPPDRVFYNSRQVSLGGNSTGKVGPGTVTYALPPSAPPGATGAQVRVMVSGASAAGTITVFNGSSTPGVTSLAFDQSVILTSSVLVPVTAGRTVSFTITRQASVALALEGWVAPGKPLLTVPTAARLVATSTRVTSFPYEFPAGYYGKVALLNLGVSSALGYGNLTVSSSGLSAPNMQTMSFGPQQPQSGFLWVYVPANGRISITLTQGALLGVDLVGYA